MVIIITIPNTLHKNDKGKVLLNGDPIIEIWLFI